MAAPPTDDFVTGVIEGFYGKPWSLPERLELFDWMAAWGLNTYLYAPKDDLKHRAAWREPYFESEAIALRRVITACQQHRIRFIYALGPGLDLRYSEPADQQCLQARFAQILGLGGRDFAILFDDIPDRLSDADGRAFHSFAAAHCATANALFRWVRERSPQARFFFCPTAYCGRMDQRQFGGEGYLDTVGESLAPEIDVFWTGPEIISPEITAASLRQLSRRLRRKPILWDNLHANDYDRRRFYCGPYAGRAPELRTETRGVLCNPNNEFPLNYVPLRTMAEFARSPAVYQPRAAYLAAIREWLSRFVGRGATITFEELVLFGDCYYLPQESGSEAKRFLDLARQVLARNPVEWGKEGVTLRRQVAALRSCCQQMAFLRDRPLFYALSRRAWELGEEMDLLEKFLEGAAQTGLAVGRSDFHLPGTYRGGMVPELQKLLVQHDDGTFTPATSASPSNPSI